MVLEKYIGPLRDPLSTAANLLASKLTEIGFSPPAEAALIDALIITAFFLLLSLIVLLTPSKRDQRNAVLLVGVSGENDAPSVGKTTLFKYLRYGSLLKHGTVPSLQVNEGVFAPSASTFAPCRWIDFPGHSRLRHELAKYITSAKCIIFVIDAQRFTAQARRDAELLYDVLTNPFVAKHGTPVLIFCNKSEMPNAAKVVMVQTRLEAELERARNANMSTLQSAGVGDQPEATSPEEQRAMLGFENEPFSFDHAPSSVTFAAGSAATGAVQPILNFVASSFL